MLSMSKLHYGNCKQAVIDAHEEIVNLKSALKIQEHISSMRKPLDEKVYASHEALLIEMEALKADNAKLKDALKAISEKRVAENTSSASLEVVHLKPTKPNHEAEVTLDRETISYNDGLKLKPKKGNK